MAASLYLALLIIIVFRVLYWYYGWSKVARLINKIPGPRTLPIIGNAHQLRKSIPELFSDILGRVVQFRQDKMMRLWLGTTPVVVLFKPESVEQILTSSVQITKSFEYDMLFDWLGTGLLTSSGDKWHSRRKLLTSAFHFQILNDFIYVFCDQSKCFVQKLQDKVDKEAFDIYPYITLCTLDIICETSMGVKVNAQQQENSGYVKAINTVCTIFSNRVRSPLLWPNLIFRFFGRGKEYYANLEILHKFTRNVIQERSEELKAKKQKIDSNSEQMDRKHKRLAFLDLLLDISDDGKMLSHNDIQEEVDTIMFEGHDTTASTAFWAIYLIGAHPKVQNKINQEIDSIFCGSDRQPTVEDLKSMKYLECAIKETMRLFSTVPFLGRRLTEDFEILGYKIPKGTNMVLNLYALHRDPDSFPDPEVFNPDRFLSENSIGRHSFAYLPFSAGPRNCIGQRFALLEEKVLLSYLLRHFTIESIQPRHEVIPVGLIVLRPYNSVKIKLHTKR